MICLVSYDVGGAELLSCWARYNKKKFLYCIKGPALKVYKKNIKGFKNSSAKDIKKKTTKIITSTSKISDHEINFLKYGIKKKIKTISILSHKYAKVAPLSKLNKRLFEITDMFIDNKIPIGDSLSKINNITVGPASTIIGSFILNTILVELAGKVKNIKPFPFYISSNMPNSNSNNNILIKKYKRLNKHL